MTLPYDVARCAVTHENYHCPLKHHCLRRLDKGRAEYQPFTEFKGGVDCDGFIDAQEPDQCPPQPSARRCGH